MLIRNLYNSTWRNYYRNSFHTVLNLIGLSVSLAAVYLIAQYAYSEYSYEKHITNYKQKYRITLAHHYDGTLRTTYATNYLPVGEILSATLPSVKSSSRFYMFDRHAVVTHANQAYKVDNIAMADKGTLSFFDFEVIQGRLEQSLSGPEAVAISASTAQQIFGTEDPIGKRLELDNEEGKYILRIAAVYADAPSNSHFRPSLLVSTDALKPIYQENKWGWNFFATYIEIGSEFGPDEVAIAVNDVLKDHLTVDSARLSQTMQLQPLADIHLHSKLEFEIAPNSEARIVNLIILVGLAILTIAIINYVNLTTARMLTRAKEIGVRKTLGSTLGQLRFHFFMEATPIVFVAMLGGITIAQTSLPFLNEVFDMSLSFELMGEQQFWIFNSALLVITIFLAGIYPALRMASFHTIDALKGDAASMHESVLLRNTLVLSQFTAALLILIFALAATEQFDFMLRARNGINMDRVLVLNGPRVMVSNEKTGASASFVDALTGLPEVVDASSASSIPGVWMGAVSNVKGIGKTVDASIVYHIYGVDEHFTDVYDMKVLAGRSFGREFGDEKSSVLLNESAMRRLGYAQPEDVVGETFEVRGERVKVVGVFEDYHHFSLKERIGPILVTYRPDDSEYFAIRMSGSSIDLKQSISRIENLWHAFFPGNPFDFYFQDSFFEAQYASDRQTKTFFVGLTGLSMFIAFLGLFGLMAFLISRRKKEVGIRKTLGASEFQIVSVLSAGVVKIMMVAFLVALPLGSYLIIQWLQGYAYHIGLSPRLFAYPVILTILVVALAIGGAVWKSGRVNPVEILRNE